MRKQTYTRDEIIDILIAERDKIDYEMGVCDSRDDWKGKEHRQSMRIEVNTLLEKF